MLRKHWQFCRLTRQDIPKILAHSKRSGYEAVRFVSMAENNSIHSIYFDLFYKTVLIILPKDKTDFIENNILPFFVKTKIFEKINLRPRVWSKLNLEGIAKWGYKFQYTNQDVKDVEIFFDLIKEYYKTKNSIETITEILLEVRNFLELVTKNEIKFTPVTSSFLEPDLSLANKNSTRLLEFVWRAVAFSSAEFRAELIARRFEVCSANFNEVINSKLTFESGFNFAFLTARQQAFRQIKFNNEVKSNNNHIGLSPFSLEDIRDLFNKTALLSRDDYNKLRQKQPPSLLELKQLLASGESPNQVYNFEYGSDGIIHYFNPLYVAIINALPWEYIKLLLQYGGNPFKLSDYTPCTKTPWEVLITIAKSTKLTKLSDRLQILKIISKIDFYYTGQVKKSKINNSLQYSIFNYEASVVTQFCLNNEFIYSILLSADTLQSTLKSLNLNENKLKELFKDKAFKSTTKTLEDELSGKNKLIELIYNKCELIGFIIFEKLKLKEDNIIACNYAYMDKNYRSNGLMLLLVMRLGFAVQLFDPLQKVACFASVLNYSSYSYFKNFTHFPKYDPAISSDNKLPLKDILKNIYNPSITLHGTPPTSYIHDGSAAEEKSPELERNIFYDFFFEQVLGYAYNPLKTDEPTRGATILYYISDTIFESLSSTLKLKLGIDFFKYVYTLAQHLHNLFKDFSIDEKPIKFAAYMQTDLLFWKNIKKFNTCENTAQEHSKIKSSF